MAAAGSRPVGTSLEDIHSSVPIPPGGWRRFLAFSGPAFLISVGYMDPGNWGTDLAAGSSYEYRLLWVLLLSNLMAILLQSLATRLGVVTGRDLAQACRDAYPRPTALAMWLLCEIAIAACDLAEVIGTIIALKLLFDLPYLVGLVIAAADTFLLLAMQRRGVRLLELLTLALIAVIAVSFFIEIVLARPDWAAVVWGLVPGLAGHDVGGSLYVAIGMLGATVMPHNLYLHSALVQTRAFPATTMGRRLACKYNLIDSLLALNGAFLVNAAILILAAAKFAGQEIETLQQAHSLLPRAMGTALASALFAVALLASGQSSTFTGTLAGQVVMEGFLSFRLRPWVRRLLTRALALLPAILVIALWGQGTAEPAMHPAEPEEVSACGVAAATSAQLPGVNPAAVPEISSVDHQLLELLVLSQVVLAFQLPFALIPLVHFTSNRRAMGEFASRGWLKVLGWACAVIVVGLDITYIGMQMDKWAEAAGDRAGWVYGGVGGAAAALALFLGWVTIYPIWSGWEAAGEAVTGLPLPGISPSLPAVRFHRIGVAVEFAGDDGPVLAQAVALARAQSADLVAVHVVEGLGASYYGPEAQDLESRSDRARMAELVEQLRRDGLRAEGVLGFGTPAEELVRIAGEQRFDLLVLGTHGHRFLADIALGQTVSPVLHRLPIPVLVVPSRAV